jgi:hypothetical protein
MRGGLAEVSYLKRYLKQNNVSKVITKRPGRLEMITAVMSS